MFRTNRFRPRRRPAPARFRPHVERLEDRAVPSTVTNLNDSGPGSLRDTINLTPARGVVDFAGNLSGTINLASNLPIGKDLTINGRGAGVISVSGNGASQVFNIPNGVTVTITDLSIVSGVSGMIGGVPNNLGGGIFNAGTLTLANDVLSGNTANSSVAGSGLGGAVFNSGGLTITNCLFTNNQAQANGTVSGLGGAVYNTNGMTLTNVTFTQNTAGQGAAIANVTNSPTIATINLINVTVSGNTAGATGQGGGLFLSGNSTANLRNTLVAGNTAQNGPDISGAVAHDTSFNNLVGDGTGSSGLNNNDNGNQVGNAALPINPRLGVLQNNGGPFVTLALLPNSPAIDAGTNTQAPGNDTRAFNRPVNGTTDIGAYEFQQPQTVTTLTVTPGSTTTGQGVTLQVSVSGQAANSNQPTGTVTFFDGGAALGTVSLSGGTASLTRRGFTAGTHNLTATYNGFTQGDFVFSTSTSSPVALNVRTLVYFAAGGAPGIVSLFSDFDGSSVASFTPFPGYSGRVNVTLGAVAHHGVKDLVVAASDGNPAVKVYDGRAIINGSFDPANPDGSLVTSFFAYGINFNVGANVAVGDVSGNGFPDLITGASAGNPHVKVYNGQAIANGSFDRNNPDASLLAQFFPYALQFNVGANVAAGDVNADGFADIVTGATVGNPDVRVYNGRDIARNQFNPNGSSLLAQFFAYGINFNVGAFVAVADVNRDGFGDIITGASAGNPQVKVYNGRAIANGTFSNSNPDASLLTQFFAFDLNFNIGVTVGAADFLGDGGTELLTGASAGAPNLRVVPALSSGIKPPVVNGIDLFAPGITGGVSVGA